MNSSVTIEQKKDQLQNSTANLQQRWAVLLKDEPRLRIRDAAKKLCVSELELLLLDQQSTVTALLPDWRKLIKTFEAAGPLMALSRNESAVHEKTGVYAGLRGNDVMGLMIQDKIDLRLIFQRWAFAYAVHSEKTRSSIQFFAEDGSAIHKVYCTESTDQLVWKNIINVFEDPVAKAPQLIKPAIKPKACTLSLNQQVSFLQKWSEITDVHQFLGMLRSFNVTRLQAMLIAENTWSYSVDVSAIPTFIEGLAGTGLSIMVFVSNTGIVQIHTGPIERCMSAGKWFNILDADFNLHLNTENLSRAWVVRKPTSDGVVSSVEIYDNEGELVLQLFGARQEGQSEQAQWRSQLLALAPDMPKLQA